MSDLPPTEDSLIALLDETELMVATALAVCDGLLPAPELALVLQQSVDSVSAAIDVLRDLCLVTERSDGSVVIRHALVGARLKEVCPPQDLRRLHRALATALERGGADEAFVVDHIEASAEPALVLHGIQLCLWRCRGCILLGELDDARSILDRADRLVRIALSPAAQDRFDAASVDAFDEVQGLGADGGRGPHGAAS